MLYNLHMPDGMSPENKQPSSFDAMKSLGEQQLKAAREFQSNQPQLSNIRMENDPSKGLELSPEDILQLQHENEEALRSREIEPIGSLELTTLKLVERHEKAEGSREEENIIQWPLSTHLQQLVVQEINMSNSTVVLENYAEAKPVVGKPGWYTNVSPSYGFEVQVVKVVDEYLKDKDGKEYKDKLGRPIPITSHYEDRIRLGTDRERDARVDRIQKFTGNVIARLKFSGLYGHVFKRSIENIPGLASLYLATVDVKPGDIKSLLTLPAVPEDRGKELTNQGGVKYEQDTAMGDMIVSAWAIFNAVGLSEKPELFKQFVDLKGWNRHVLADPSKSAEWFGNPSGWAKDVESGGRRESGDWDKEKGSRGHLTHWGNVFVREDFETPREFRRKVIEYLGGSETAKQAVELGWRYFKLFASADYVGYEWYYDNKRGEVHATIPLGGDVASDFGKAMHPDAYLEFYRANSRGAVPRGAYGKIKPFAVDVLRGMIFGENYVGPDEKRLGQAKKIDGKDKVDSGGVVETERVSLYDLLYVHGLKSDQIDFGKLPDRALIGPYLRFFMSNAGGEYGGGSFDILTDKITSPDPYLTPVFWEKLKSKVHVGITKENVAWANFTKSGGKEPYKIPEPKEVDKYKLDIIRTMLDAVFAEEISRKWDEKPELWGSGTNVGRWKGVAESEKRQYPVSWRIIAIANQTINGLEYDLSRLEKVRKEFLVDKKEDTLWPKKS